MLPEPRIIALRPVRPAVLLQAGRDPAIVPLEILDELDSGELAVQLVELDANGYSLTERTDHPPYTHLLKATGQVVADGVIQTRWYLARLE